MREDRSRKARWLAGTSLLGALAVVGVLGYRLGMEEWSIRQLQSPDLAVRMRAVEQLAELGSGRAIPHLLEAAVKAGAKLDFERAPAEVETITAALERIVWVEDREAVSAALGSESAWVQYWALQKLGDMPPDPRTFESLRRWQPAARREPLKANSYFSDEILPLHESFSLASTYGRAGAAFCPTGSDLGLPAIGKDGSFASGALCAIGPNAKAHRSALLAYLRGMQDSNWLGYLDSGNLSEIDSHFAEDLLDDVRGSDESARDHAFELWSWLDVEDPEVGSVLRAALDDPRPFIRGMAMLSLARASPNLQGAQLEQIRKALADSEPWIRVCASAAITRADPASTDQLGTLLTRLARKQSDDGRLTIVIPRAEKLQRGTLLSLSPIQFSSLSSSVTRSPRRVADIWAAAVTLRVQPTNEAARACLLSALEGDNALDEMDNFPEEAARMLTYFEPGAPGFSRELAVELEKWAKRDDPYGLHASLALANLGDCNWAELLERMENTGGAEPFDWIPWVEWQFVRLPIRHLAPIVETLRHDLRPARRAAAAAALGCIRSAPADVVPTLLDALRDHSHRVRHAAIDSLIRLQPRALGVAAALVERVPKLGEARDLFRVLETLGQESVPPLVALLADANPELRTLAAWTLGKLRADAHAAVPDLAKALTNDTDAITRWTAAEALGRIGPAAEEAEAVLELAAASEDAELARYARGALRRLAR